MLALPMPSRSLGLSAAVLLAILAGGCGREEGTGRAVKLPEVVVTKAITGQVIDYQDFTGRLSAVKTVAIRARVSGYVTEVPFKEGDLVRKGDTLFLIDETIYAAALEKAQADVRLYEAQKQLLDAQYARNSRLISSGAVSREDFDIIAAQRGQAVANIAAAKANVKTAQQNLDWTRVTAPFSGRISRRIVDPGNLVKADDTVLTTLVTEDPIYVYFDVDERTYMDLVDSASSGVEGWLSGTEVPVVMRLANEKDFRRAGTVDFVDNQVNATTGTIRLRGVFANHKSALKPGLFARVRLPRSIPYNSVLVPDEALQSDQGRKYVYIVNDKNEVVYRRVKLGQAVMGLRAIKDGVAEGERVVVSGMQRVRPGTQVEVRVQAAPAPPASPLGKLVTFQRPATKNDKVTR
jgi:RND family efflux transporter MFP subunit